MTPRRGALAASALLVAVALLFLRPLATPGPALRDFEAYYAAGVTWHAGGDPYAPEIWNVEREVPGVVATRDELLPFVGPPFTLPFWALLAALGFARASVVWTIVLVAAALTLVLVASRIAGARDPVSIAAACLFAAAFGPLTSAVALGQVALVASAGVVLTAIALEARRLPAAIGAALLAATQPNIAIALTERLSDRLTWLSLGLAAGLAFAGSIAAIGFLPFGRYMQLLEAHAVAESSLAIQLTISGVAFGLGARPWAARIIGDVVAVAVVVATVLVLRDRSYSATDRVAIACATLPLVVPFAHEHDLTIVLFPAILVLRRARRGLWPIAAAAMRRRRGRLVGPRATPDRGRAERGTRGGRGARRDRAAARATRARSRRAVRRRAGGARRRLRRGAASRAGLARRARKDLSGRGTTRRPHRVARGTGRRRARRAQPHRCAPASPPRSPAAPASGSSR